MSFYWPVREICCILKRKEIQHLSRCIVSSLIREPGLNKSKNHKIVIDTSEFPKIDFKHFKKKLKSKKKQYRLSLQTFKYSQGLVKHLKQSENKNMLRSPYLLNKKKLSDSVLDNYINHKLLEDDSSRNSSSSMCREKILSNLRPKKKTCSSPISPRSSLPKLDYSVHNLHKIQDKDSEEEEEHFGDFLTPQIKVTPRTFRKNKSYVELLQKNYFVVQKKPHGDLNTSRGSGRNSEKEFFNSSSMMGSFMNTSGVKSPLSTPRNIAVKITHRLLNRRRMTNY